MAEYAIGDVQGCYEPLMRLLDHIHFDEKKDKLWFVGDLVNRGPHSLEVLRFIKQLPIAPHITLGNHDLHFLIQLERDTLKTNADDTIDKLLNAHDAKELGFWLRHQSILVHDPDLKIIMCHAGIAPTWTITEAKQRAHYFEQALQSDHYKMILSHLYGNKPNFYEDTLLEMDALRVICNYFTRMRFCDAQGRLVLTPKGSPKDSPNHIFPWFKVPNRCIIDGDIVFGHWAALNGVCPTPHLYAIDTGCVWGNSLTALRLDTKERFTVSAGV